MRRIALLGLCFVLTGCPERRPPERGIQLTYRKPGPESVRAVVDRRLAQLKVRANLSEDDSTLTVRVPEGADVSRIKAVLAQAGTLDFCAEDAAVAAHWCEQEWPSKVSVERSGQSTCSLRAASRKELESALADGGTFASGPVGERAEAWSIANCLAPRVVSAQVSQTPPSLMLEFDRAGGRDFAAFTKSVVGGHLVIRIDGVVSSAPVVIEPITGGKAMLTSGLSSRAELELLAASLVGGALPPLVLEREGTWGPPSLTR